MPNDLYTNGRKKQLSDRWHFAAMVGYIASLPFTIYFAIRALNVLSDAWDGWTLLLAVISGAITIFGQCAWLVGGIDNKG
jgi:hypothetical protein